MTSLNSIKDKEQRKRYYSNILIIGGGGQLQKLNEEIIMKLNTRLGFSQEENRIDKVDLATDLFTREISPVHVAWLGGTVIPKLDMLRDLWIEKGKFIGELPEGMDDDDELPNEKKQMGRR
jgi:actin-related protein